MMDYIKEVEKEISHIGILDIISSKIRKHPKSINEYSEDWDRNLSNFLDTNPEVVDMDLCDIKLSNGIETLTLCIEFFPYYYGHKSGWGHKRLTPSWSTILKLRKIQAKHKNIALDKVKECVVIK